MKIKNEAETIVGKEMTLRARRSAKKASPPLGGILAWFSSKGDESPRACDCAICSTDIAAFALTKLPPCYSRGHNFGLSRAGMDAARVNAAVELAIERVSRRPRHSPRAAVRLAEGVRLIDFGLEAGSQIIRPLLSSQQGLCLCEDCLEDTLAYGLNRVSPRYGVEVRGSRRLPPHLMDFLRDEIGGAILRAARVIAANPRH